VRPADSLPKQAPFWLLLFGVAALGAGYLVTGRLQ